MGILHVKDASLVNRCGAEPISMRNRTDLGEGEEAGVSLPFVPPLPVIACEHYAIGIPAGPRTRPPPPSGT